GRLDLVGHARNPHELGELVLQLGQGGLEHVGELAPVRLGELIDLRLQAVQLLGELGDVRQGGGGRGGVLNAAQRVGQRRQVAALTPPAATAGTSILTVGAVRPPTEAILLRLSSRAALTLSPTPGRLATLSACSFSLSRAGWTCSLMNFSFSAAGSLSTSAFRSSSFLLRSLIFGTAAWAVVTSLMPPSESSSDLTLLVRSVPTWATSGALARKNSSHTTSARAARPRTAGSSHCIAEEPACWAPAATDWAPAAA